MTLSHAFRRSGGFLIDLFAGIAPALWLLVLNFFLAQICLTLVFLAFYGVSEGSFAAGLTLLLFGLGLLAIPILGGTACLALIGALIVRHRAGGLTRLSGKWREFLRIFLTLGAIFPVPGYLLFGQDSPTGPLLLYKDPFEGLSVGVLLLLNAYIYLCPAAMSYRTLRLLKTAGGST